MPLAYFDESGRRVKSCTRCGEIKSVSDYKPAQPSRQMEDGLSSACTECVTKSRAAHRAKLRERRPEIEKKAKRANPYPNEAGEMVKRCTRCDFVMPVSSFYTVRPKNAPARPSSWCPDCTSRYYGRDKAHAARMNSLRIHTDAGGHLVKLCCRCDKIKPVTEYSAAKGACKSCVRERIERDPELRERRRQATLASKKRNPEKAKLHTNRARAKRSYGISLETIELMRLQRDFRCDICNEKRDGKHDKMLATDHCHSSGRFRGMLCGQCNKALGLLKDSPERLRAAAIYLESHTERKR